MGQLAIFDFDAQTPNAEVTASAPWSSLGEGSMIASAAAAAHGALGGRIDTPTALRQIRWAEASSTATRVADMYIRVRALPNMAYILGLMDGASSRASARINTDRTVSIRNTTTAVATSAVALELDQLYRIAWRISTSGQELRVYEGESETPLFTLTGALTDATHTLIGFGMTALSGGFAADYDDLRVGDDWLPAVDPQIPLDTPVLTLGAKTNASSYGASDGSQVVTWPPVAGAHHYVAEINSGSGYTIVSSAATSPFMFTGLAAGTYTVGITAHPEA